MACRYLTLAFWKICFGSGHVLILHGAAVVPIDVGTMVRGDAGDHGRWLVFMCMEHPFLWTRTLDFQLTQLAASSGSSFQSWLFRAEHTLDISVP